MSLLECKCAAPLWALGIPDCHPVLRPIRRVAFETNLTGTNDPTAFYLLTSTFYTDARRLMTPLLYNVESEKPEPVFEELSGNRFFVRHNPRNFRAIVAKPPAEWGINIEQLRCRSRLGVFLIDDAGVVWAQRIDAETARPIPIEPATVVQRMLFPSDTTITKYEISFDFARDFMDYELVPVYADNNNLLNYVPLIAGRLDVLSTALGLRIRVFALYAQSSNFWFVPIPGLAGNIRVRDNSGTVVSTSFTETQPGVYVDSSFTYNSSDAPYTADINPLPTGIPFDLTTAIATF